MRVLVCGGRDYRNRDRVFEVLDGLARSADRPESMVVMAGGASGADEHAADWAACRLVYWKEFRADWQKHGRAAGPIRNQQMLTEGRPTIVVAFPGGRGTADMVRRAESAGVKVMKITD